MYHSRMPARKQKAALTPYCATYTRAIEIIGKRWSGAILRAMVTGSCRFSEILGQIPGLSDRLLSQRLRELEAEGIVERRVTPSTPVRIDYLLTDKGRALSHVIAAVAEWAETWGVESPAGSRPAQTA